MSVQAWLIFLLGFALFAGYCVVVVIRGPGTVSQRRAVVRSSIKEVFQANRQLVYGAIIGMLALNSFFAIFPADRNATAETVSSSEEGRLIIALALFFLMNAAWYSVLVRMVRVIRKGLEKI